MNTKFNKDKYIDIHNITYEDYIELKTSISIMTEENFIDKAFTMFKSSLTRTEKNIIKNALLKVRELSLTPYELTSNDILVIVRQVKALAEELEADINIMVDFSEFHKYYKEHFIMYLPLCLIRNDDRSTVYTFDTKKELLLFQFVCCLYKPLNILKKKGE